MHWFKPQGTALDPSERGLFAWLGRLPRFLSEKLPGEENPTHLLIELTILVLLLHVCIFEYGIKLMEPIVPAQPLVMNVSLIEASTEKAKAAAPAVKRQPSPKSSKKVRLTPKKTPLAPKPRKPSIVSAPGPAPVSVAPQPESSQTQISSSSPNPAASGVANRKQGTETVTKTIPLNDPKPEYPRIALKRGWEGTVSLLIQVTPEGHSGSVTVDRTSGHDALDKAAVETARTWTFIPAKRGETPVAAPVTVKITFRLSKS